MDFSNWLCRLPGFSLHSTPSTPLRAFRIGVIRWNRSFLPNVKVVGCFGNSASTYYYKNIRNAPMLLHNKKSDFPCQKQCMFKMWVYICMIYWIFFALEYKCKSKAMNAIIALLLHNKTSVTRRYFFIIKNRTFHVENNVCLKSWCTFARFVEFFRT